MDTKWLRNSFVYLIILVAIIALFFTVFQPGSMDRDAQIGLNELAAAVKRGEVKRIDVAEDKLTIEIPGRGKFTARKERNDTVPELMASYGVSPAEFERVDYRVNDPPQFTNWLGLLVNLLPLIFFGAILLFMMRQAQGSNNQALSFGKSRARMFMGNKPTITFQDVAGVEEDKREQTLNQILVEMDGFDSNTNVIVIAATNRPDVLDPALLRPGRFDRQVVLPAPDINGRKAILEVHAKGKPFDKNVDLSVLAKVTPGFSGADLANLINEGAILAARRNKKTIGMSELEEAIDRVIAGPERKSRVMSDKEKELTAYHESGHAVAMRFLEHHDPVHKITIISRGMMGGYTRSLPPEDRYYMTKRQFKAMLASALGGHAAEQVVFGEISTGAENDIEKATNIARKMVKEYGMSERLGTVALGHKEELVFLGREIGEQKNYSEKTAEAIDEEIRRLIDEGYRRAVDIITGHRDVLDRLAKALIQYETLDGENLERVFRGEPPLEGGTPEPPQAQPSEPA